MIFRGKKALSIFLTALALALAFASNSPAAATAITQVYGTASDGTILHWVAHTPSTPGPWPAVLIIHGGGFDAGTPTDSAESVICAQDLADAGYLALSIEYRLAPPGRLAGQVSSGRFPDQPNDIKVAVRAARSDSRCTGQVGSVGGSAGGAHTAFAATTGTKGDDRIDVGVSLSGAYDFTDFSPNPDLATYTKKVINYVGVTSANTTALQAASAAWQVDQSASPLLLINTVEDPMPYSQLPDMIAKLDTAGVTNYQAFSLPGHQHSFSYWPTVKDQALAFLAAGFAGVVPPPPSPAPTPGALDARQLLNVSTRTRVENGDGVTVGGFIVTGANAKRVVLRGLGPSLAQSGLGATLSDPLLQLFDGNGILVESNDNWKPPGSLTADLIPANTSESLLTAILPAGNYTAVLSGVGGGSGVALFELYDLDPKSSRVSNISTRGETGTGADVIIGGFIIGGTDSTKVIVRALGPSLGSLGLAGALQDPVLELHDSNGALLFSNDNWRSTQEQQIIDTTIPPTNDRESAIVATLAPGNYTAIVSGAGGSTGVGLVEVYDLQSR
ncbi:MAG: alpha/beta hydrolase [Chthoniobacterales bacterium]|nr:alpha/beta hydrolase [Chthoniobacterales bacterium]